MAAQRQAAQALGHVGLAAGILVGILKTQFVFAQRALAKACPPPALVKRSHSHLFLAWDRSRNEGAMSAGALPVR
jgi:hypothetical protein